MLRGVSRCLLLVQLIKMSTYDQLMPEQEHSKDLYWRCRVLVFNKQMCQQALHPCSRVGLVVCGLGAEVYSRQSGNTVGRSPRKFSLVDPFRAAYTASEDSCDPPDAHEAP